MAGSSDPIARLLLLASEPLRAMIVIAGAVLIHLSLGTYHTFGCFPLAMVIGGCLYHRFGARPAAFIGCALMSSGVALSAITIRHSFPAFLFTYGLMFGLGQGIAYVVSVACAINWSPHNIGLVSGVVVAGFGISASIFAPIQTAMVNPKNYIPSKTGYFPQADLLARVPELFTKLSLVYVIMQAIGLVVICDPPTFFHDTNAISNVICCPQASMRAKNRRPWDRSVTYRRVPVDDSQADDTVNLLADSDSDDAGAAQPAAVSASSTGSAAVMSMNTAEMLSSATFYWLFAALFCCSFYGNLFYNLYKTFAETFIDDDMFLAFAFSAGSIANSIARIGWGYLNDRTSFQVSLVIATGFATVLLLTMPITPTSGRYGFMLWLILMFICMAATHALFISATVRCFGPKHKATNYGFLILSTTLSGILLAIGAEYWLQTLGYRWVFLLTAAFPFAAFLITSAIHTTSHGNRIS